MMMELTSHVTSTHVMMMMRLTGIASQWRQSPLHRLQGPQPCWQPCWPCRHTPSLPVQADRTVALLSAALFWCRIKQFQTTMAASLQLSLRYRQYRRYSDSKPADRVAFHLHQCEQLLPPTAVPKTSWLGTKGLMPHTCSTHAGMYCNFASRDTFPTGLTNVDRIIVSTCY